MGGRSRILDETAHDAQRHFTLVAKWAVGASELCEDPTSSFVMASRGVAISFWERIS